ncbi:Tim9-Tim10 complex subunit Tim10 [Schizosaccharomyces octosporus yFS286]|uniref:Mitochondrial import inner membrane translocase subunit n=1 Tax=Schizosaccharomyces octosporus (strain yFS286) TaxID=483514 RepID=S9Q4T9_SCHOY|nr:Tim9-Tim10 complex subunit Tim10 [Schizosaccharomyces octosporus yFS286]EPX74633.1 Tim9-Tim10 complex subunit Tim10 [Schizosaccharomyces octosporus yFS286]
MSFFGIGKGNQSVNPQNIAMAEQEVELSVEIFNRMVSSCHKKCIATPYKEAELTKGESVCIDRCVAKYFESSKVLGEHMKKIGEQNAPPQ